MNAERKHTVLGAALPSPLPPGGCTLVDQVWLEEFVPPALKALKEDERCKHMRLVVGPALYSNSNSGTAVTLYFIPHDSDTLLRHVGVAEPGEYDLNTLVDKLAVATTHCLASKGKGHSYAVAADPCPDCTSH